MHRRLIVKFTGSVEEEASGVGGSTGVPIGWFRKLGTAGMVLR